MITIPHLALLARRAKENAKINCIFPSFHYTTWVFNINSSTNSPMTICSVWKQQWYVQIKWFTRKRGNKNIITTNITL
jgi:hypothetical protein